MADATLEPPSEDDDGEEDEDHGEEEDDEEDEDWAWSSDGANLAKRYNGSTQVRPGQVRPGQVRPGQVRPVAPPSPSLNLCLVQSNRQAWSSRAAGSHLSDKALSRYEHKINLGNEP